MKGVFRASDRVFQPWKNGGGETAEILVAPTGAGIDQFDWRLSTAIVASDGPFSSFPGIDRVLVILDGGPILLRLGDEQQSLTTDSPPFAFAGDRACSARLTGPDVLDFNIMLRRPLKADVTRGPLMAPEPGALAAYALLLEPRAGLARLDLIDQLEAPALAQKLYGAQAISVRIYG